MSRRPCRQPRAAWPCRDVRDGAVTGRDGAVVAVPCIPCLRAVPPCLVPCLPVSSGGADRPVVPGLPMGRAASKLQGVGVRDLISGLRVAILGSPWRRVSPGVARAAAGGAPGQSGVPNSPLTGDCPGHHRQRQVSARPPRPRPAPTGPDQSDQPDSARHLAVSGRCGVLPSHCDPKNVPPTSTNVHHRPSIVPTLSLSCPSSFCPSSFLLLSQLLLSQLLLSQLLLSHRRLIAVEAPAEWISPWTAEQRCGSYLCAPWK